MGGRHVKAASPRPSVGWWSAQGCLLSVELNQICKDKLNGRQGQDGYYSLCDVIWPSIKLTILKGPIN